jgi:hypothetical protein|tara:strand:- start:20 stop:394 length:375 start_codon:yes stop_codon:yes gene_type:complete
MKKILVILFVSLIVSCAGNDDNTTNKSINPPSWIQGIWALNDSATVGGVAFDFRADDFCQGQFGIGFTCWKAQGTYFDNFSVFEEVSNTRYFVILSYAGGEQTFEFDKVSDTSIMYNGNTYVKQ